MSRWRSNEISATVAGSGSWVPALLDASREATGRPPASAWAMALLPLPFSPVMTQAWKGSTFHEKSRKMGWLVGPIVAPWKETDAMLMALLGAMLTGAGRRTMFPARFVGVSPPPQTFGAPRPKGFVQE